MQMTLPGKVRTLHDNTPVRAEFLVPPVERTTSARVVIIGGGSAGTLWGGSKPMIGNDQPVRFTTSAGYSQTLKKPSPSFAPPLGGIQKETA